MKRNTAKILLYLVTAVALMGIAMLRHSATNESNEKGDYTLLSGTVFNTIYHIQYDDTTNYHREIQQLFTDFDASLSMFNKESLITRINQGDTSVVINDYLRTVLEKSYEISQLTNGAFDITVAPLTNLWGFGFKNADNVSPEVVDSILQFVGFQKTRIDKNGHFIKDDPRIVLDASSIAKGYMCDVVADFLREHNVVNYMVEIGGEITCAGQNSKGSNWGVGINEPLEDSLSVENKLQNIVRITNCGVATSGNYRRFYTENGRRYGHIIDPHSGYPVQQDILSSTVIAPDCITADALATAFMVMGSERAMRIIEADTTLMAYFICSSKNDGEKYEILYSPKLKNMLSKQQ